VANKTQPVADLVQEVLQTLPTPYGEDIIEDVFIAIEHNPRWQKRYDALETLLGKHVLNQFVGWHTRDQTDLKTIQQVKATRSTLTKSYSKLRPQS